MDKKALNNIKQKGFDSKAQVRLLLLRAREYPERYSWVYKALRDHGLPEVEGPLKTYWDEPYNVSPTTPSYTYISPLANINSINLIKLAKKIVSVGKSESAKVIANAILQKYYVDHDLVQKVANQFWTIAKEMTAKDRTAYVERLFNKLENFQPYNNLNSVTQTEIRQQISKKIIEGR